MTYFDLYLMTSYVTWLLVRSIYNVFTTCHAKETFLTKSIILISYYLHLCWFAWTTYIWDINSINAMVINAFYLNKHLVVLVLWLLLEPCLARGSMHASLLCMSWWQLCICKSCCVVTTPFIELYCVVWMYELLWQDHIWYWYV